MDAATVMTDVQFADMALWKGARTGGITSFTGGDLEEQAGAAYWPLTDALLTLTTWRFNTSTVRLTQLSAAPASRWDYRYSLPSDRLGDPTGTYFDADCLAGSQDFEIFEDELWCDDAIVYVLYQRRPSSPGKWGPLFRDFAMTALAAELALGVNEDRSRYETLKIQAYGSLDESRLGGKLALALAREAMTTPPVQTLPDGGPLVRAHLGGLW